jgi:PiT family inorganic phosphate transporter
LNSIVLHLEASRMLTAILFLSVCFVAFTNGANANFKGVASLYGSGTMTLRQAGWWGTATTFAGSIAALFFAQGLLPAFSGRGLVSNSLLSAPEFLCAVALGAALTSFLATRVGFPVSTTHSLVGALVGAGLAGHGEVQLSALVTTFVYPLCFSPVVAALAGAIMLLVLRSIRCAPNTRSLTLDVCHWLSTGGASFARGLNDTPKMAALMLVVPNLEKHWAFLIVSAVVALGGLLDIEKVAETLGKKISGMNPGEGFAASLVTAGLVITASFHSLPVSTTHVSVGALVGMGTVSHQTYWRKAFEVLLAWVSTVPMAAVLAALAYWTLKQTLSS